MVDSQCLACDPYVALTLAAGATTRLGLGTGVTNPYTRHASVTATAIASVQRLSKGRTVLGIGRGDSALAYLGLAPAPPEVFERYVALLQRYLRGEVVERDHDVPEGMRGVDTLRLAREPEGSSLKWLRPTDVKVPVDVSAAGPRVIAIAARLADRITFAVNADPARLSWAIGVARDAARAAGRDPDELSLGAHISVIPHEDRARRARSSPDRWPASRGSP